MTDELTEQFLAEHALVSLVEDVGDGDVTTEAIVSEPGEASGRIRAKETGVLAGRQLVDVTYRVLAEGLQQNRDVPKVEWSCDDGDRVESGEVVAKFEGDYDLLLTGERVALNYLQQLSGIATATRAYADVADRWDVDVYDTRKTVPHMRRLHKYAVRAGGGQNHRLTLSDGVMIKDNHKERAGGLEEALQFIDHDCPVVVEIHDAGELSALGNFDIDVIMLDNFEPDTVADLVDQYSGEAELEVSGGITLDNLESYCRTEIDRVSVGALTHSYDSLDLSIELIDDG